MFLLGVQLFLQPASLHAEEVHLARVAPADQVLEEEHHHQGTYKTVKSGNMLKVSDWNLQEGYRYTFSVTENAKNLIT